MPDVGERTLEVARDALAEQERALGEIRARGAPLLAAAGVIGGLLGKETFSDSHPDGLLEWLVTGLGIAAAITLIVATVSLFRLRRLGFSLNAKATYEWLFSVGITQQPLVDLELANRLAETRDENKPAIDAARNAFHLALASFVVLTGAFAAAAALAS